jgi:peroxiredoxin
MIRMTGRHRPEYLNTWIPERRRHAALSNRWFLLVALLMVTLASVYVVRHPRPADGPLGAGASPEITPAGTSRFAAMIGRPARDFRLTDLRGHTHTLHAYRGRVVMLIFWATWCKSCPLELPHLSEISRALASHGLVTLSINGEEEGGPVAAMARGLSFPVLRDPEDRVRTAYDAFAVPRVVIIGRDGRVAHIIRGYQGETTPVARALAEQGFSLPADAGLARLIRVEREPIR